MLRAQLGSCRGISSVRETARVVPGCWTRIINIEKPVPSRDSFSNRGGERNSVANAPQTQEELEQKEIS